MARIGLVNPQLVFSSWAAPVMRSWDDASIKHGLASLSSCLKEKGHEVRLIDLRRLRGWEAYEAVIKGEKFDCIGVTANTSEHDDALESGRRAKRVQPSILIIAGGIQPTLFPEEFLERGRGRLCAEGGGRGRHYGMDREPFRLSTGFPGQDTRPRQDTVRRQTLYSLWRDYRKRILFPSLGRYLGTPIIEMIAHRGCPWNCKYCCGPGGREVFSKVRVRSVGNVMQEMSALWQRYRFRSVLFQDDQFLIRSKWTENFSFAMHEWGFVKKDIRFAASMRADTIVENEPLMRKLKDAGLEIAIVGFESFSDRMLTWMNKGVTKAQHLEAVRILRDLKLKIVANIMLGMPWSDGKWYPEDDMMTMMTLRRIRPERANITRFTPLPGSLFYDWYKDRGMIVASSMKELGRFGKALKVKGVDYDFLDALLKEEGPARGKFVNITRDVLERLGLAEPLRRLRYELKGWKAYLKIR